MASSQSISVLISGGNSRCSWVLVCAMGLSVKRRYRLYSWVMILGEFAANSSTFSALQVSITIKYPHWEEYKVLALVQPLLITPETGCT